MEPRGNIPRVVTMILFLMASLCMVYVEGSEEFVPTGMSIEDQFRSRALATTECQHGQIFCFIRQKCVMEDGSCIPGEEPICRSDDMEVCYENNELVCKPTDECQYVQVKFTLMGHRSVTEFIEGYMRQKATIESALEKRVDGSPYDIYAVKLERLEDGRIVVHARATLGMQYGLEAVFNDRQQFVYDTRGNNIAIEWEDTPYIGPVNSPLKGCRHDQTFCLFTGQCLDNQDGTCQCPSGKVKCYADGTRRCTWRHECSFKHAVIKVTGIFVALENFFDDLVDKNRDFLRSMTTIRQLDYLKIYPDKDSLMISLGSSDVWMLDDLSALIEEGVFPQDLTGNPLDVAGYKIWDEHSHTSEHRIKYKGEFLGYEEPSYCVAGQTFCFLAGKCVDDYNVVETDGTCPCTMGQVKCFKDNKVQCVDSDQCTTFGTAVLDLDVEFSSIEYTYDALKEKAFATLAYLGVQHVDYLDFHRNEEDSKTQLYIRTSDEAFFAGIMGWVEEQQFPRTMDDTPYKVIGLVYYLDDYTRGGRYFVNDDGVLSEYQDPIHYCHQGQSFCFVSGKCINDREEYDEGCHCTDGKIQCVKDGKVTCTHYNQCQYGWAMMNLEGDLSSISDQPDLFKKKIYDDLLHLGLKHVQHLELSSDSANLYIRSSDMNLHNVLLQAIADKTFPTRLDGTPLLIDGFVLGYEDDKDGVSYYYFNEGVLTKYEEHGQTCGKGQTFCFFSGKCMNDDDEVDGGTCPCPIGMEQCVKDDGRECVYPGECQTDMKYGQEDPTKQGEMCHEGQTFCFLSGKCMTDSTEVVGGTCPCPMGMVKCVKDDETECVYPYECRTDGKYDGEDYEVQGEMCHNGQIFCFLSGKCMNDFTEVDGGTCPCPIGMVKCGKDDEGECVYPAECRTDGKYGEGDRDIQGEMCHNGQTFCFLTGKCMNNTAEDESGTCPCPIEKVQCVKDGVKECVYQGECQTDGKYNGEDHDIQREMCTHGQTFCFLSGNCMNDDDDGGICPCPLGKVQCVKDDKTECVYPDECLPDGRYDGEEGDIQGEMCHAGQTFCFLSGKCMNDSNAVDGGTCPCPMGKVQCGNDDKTECMYPDECRTDGNNDGEDKDVQGQMCHDGQTFCFLSGKCMDDTVETVSGTCPCPIGKVQCNDSTECVYPDECHTDDGGDGREEMQGQGCSLGQMFCFERGQCIDASCVIDDSTTECPIGQVVCGSEEYKCKNKSDCPIYTVTISFAENYNTIVGDKQEQFKVFLLNLMAPAIRPDTVIDTELSSGSDLIVAKVNTTTPPPEKLSSSDEGSYTTFIESLADTDLEFDGRLLSITDITVTDSDEEIDNVETEEETESFMIWARLTENSVVLPFIKAVFHERTLPFADQLNAFEETAMSQLQSAFESNPSALVHGVDFTNVLYNYPAGDKVVLVAGITTDKGVEVTAVQDALTDLNVGSNDIMIISSLEVWKTLGQNAPNQIYTCPIPIVYGRQTMVDISTILPEEMLALTGLNLDCSAEDADGLSIMENDDLIQTAAITIGEMPLKSTSEMTKFVRCEIQNIPDAGQTKAFIRFLLVNKGLFELSNIKNITANQLTMDEDSDCMPFPEDLFTFTYQGEEMFNLLTEQAWLTDMVDLQAHLVDPGRVISTAETMLTEVYEEIKNKKPLLRASVSPSSENGLFKGNRPIKFKFNGNELAEIRMGLASPHLFEYCLATDFHGSLELDVLQDTARDKAPVEAVISIEVLEQNDKPTINTVVAEDISTIFFFPKVSSPEPPIPDFRVGSLAALLCSDVDLEGSVEMGLGILGFSGYLNTIPGSWEYGSEISTWTEIPAVTSVKELSSHAALDAILLTEGQKIRFTPSTDDLQTTWLKAQSPHLVAFCWDKSNEALITDKTQVNITINECNSQPPKTYENYCVEGSAYSKTIKLIKLARKGCDDAPGSGLTETRCGCGQLEDECLDCNSLPNGEAKLDSCGICAGGDTEITPKVVIDCSDSACRTYNLEYCEEKEAEEELLTGLCSEGEQLNKCYTTSTVINNRCINTTLSSQVDSCGVECGDNECMDCEGVPNGNKDWNLCGNCADKATLNEGCDSLGDINPKSSFVHREVTISVKVSPQIVITENSEVTCRLEPMDPVDGQVTPDVELESILSQSLTLLASVSNQNKAASTGSYGVACNIDGIDMSTAQTEQYYQRYNYPTLSAINPSVFDSDNAPEYVTVTGTGFVNTGEISCLIPFKTRNLTAPARWVSKTEIRCDLKKIIYRLRGGTYNISVILNKLKTMFQELESLTTQQTPLALTVRLPAPTLKAFYHNSDCQRITIKSNIRIMADLGTTGNCLNIFNEDIFGQATCELCNGRVCIKGVDVGNVPVGTILTVKDNVIRSERELSTNPNYFTGTVEVAAPEDQTPPLVSINDVPSLIGCNKQGVFLIIRRKRCWVSSITWTATVEDDSDPAVLEKLNSIKDFMSGKEKFRLDQNQFASEAVNFTATWTLTEQRTSEVVTGSSVITIRKDEDTGRALTISGPEEAVPMDKPVKLKGNIKGCKLNKNDEILMSWTMVPPIFNSFPANKHTVRVPKNVLPEETDIAITFSVIIGGKVLSTTKTFRTSSLPLEPKILYKGKAVNEREEASIDEDLQLECENAAGTGENKDISAIWTAMDNTYGDMLPKIEFTSDLNVPKRWEVFGRSISIDKTELNKELRQEMICSLKRGTQTSEARTTLSFIEANTLEKPVIRAPEDSLYIYEGASRLKIKAYCKFVKRFTWKSQLESGGEGMLLKSEITQDLGETNEKRVKCGLTIDLADIELSMDVKYILLLEAVNEQDGNQSTVYRYFHVKYVAKPVQGGTIEASYDGPLTAMKDLVTFTFDGWNSEELRCRIFYRMKSSGKRKRLLTQGYVNVYDSVEYTFPEGEFMIEAKCCDQKFRRDLCTKINMDETLVVTAPVLPDYTSILDELAIKLMTGEPTFKALLISIKFGTELSDEDKEKSDGLAEASIMEELDYYELDVEIDLVEFLETCDDIKGTVNVMDRKIDAPIFTKFADLLMTTAQGLTGQGRSTGRRKRDTSTSTATGMNVNDAETLLQSFDDLLISDPLSVTEAGAFKGVIDLVMLGLCQNYTGPNVSVAGSDHVTIRAVHGSLTGNAATEYDVSCDGCSSITNPAKVLYGAEVANTSSEVCISSAQILIDTISPLGSGIQPTRMSDLVILKLFDQDGFEEKALTDLPSKSVTVTLTLNNDTINSTAYDYVCKMWVSDTWSDTQCTTGNPTLDGSTSKYNVQCACNALGILGVFRDLKNDEDTTTTMEATTTSTKATTTTQAPAIQLLTSTQHVDVKYTCTNNYPTTVLDKTSFISHMKSELSSQTGIPTNSIKNLDALPGSILISFELYSGSNSGQTLGQMLYILENMFNSGTITLTDTSGNALNFQAGSFGYVERGATSSSGNSDGKSDNLGLIIGAVLGGLAIIGIVVVVVVLIVKKYSVSKTHPSRRSSTIDPANDAPPAYSLPPLPPPSYLYSSPPSSKLYPETTDKWIENELAKAVIPIDSGSRPSSRDSTQHLIGNRQGRNGPTPVD